MLLLSGVSQSTSLPVLAEPCLVLESWLDDPLTDIEDSAAVIEQDPALTANLLRHVHITTGTRPLSIPAAIRISGRDGLRMMLRSCEIVRGLGLPHALRMQTFIDHAVNVALLSRLQAAATGHDENVAYLAGLLHDVGMLAALRLAPEHLLAVVHEQMTPPSLPNDEWDHGVDPMASSHSESDSNQAPIVTTGIPIPATSTPLGKAQATNTRGICDDFGAGPLDWSLVLLERFGIADKVLYAHLAVAHPELPAPASALGIANAVRAAHQICAESGGSFRWDQLPNMSVPIDSATSPYPLSHDREYFRDLPLH